MKRCKAETTRANHSVPCESAWEHDGAHQGHTTIDGIRYSVTWTNPNAPTLLEEYGEGAPAPAPPVIELPRLSALPSSSTPRHAQSPTHCACGTEHSAKDSELRVGTSGMPLVAVPLGELEADPRFSWARICAGCGALYCLIWSGKSAAFPAVCTCPLSHNGPEHAAGCPLASTPAP